MEYSTLVGATGVTLLLLAFFLHLFNFLEKDGLTYVGMNFMGASLACYASVLIDYLPFVVLEGAWALVAFYALLRLRHRRPADEGGSIH